MNLKWHENDTVFGLLTEKGGTPILCIFGFLSFLLVLLLRMMRFCANVASAEKCMGDCGFDGSAYAWRLSLKL